MKKHVLTILSLLALISAVSLTGCSDDNITTPKPDNSPEVTIGQIHTEVLNQIYADMDLAKAAKGQLDRNFKDMVVINAVNKITDRYGVERMDPQEILASVERGRQMAQQDPVQLISGLLNPEEQEWWDRFSMEAEVGNAREIYRQHCQLYGTPEYGTMLGQILDVGLSSAEFWTDYRKDQKPIYQNPYVPDNMAKSWKKFLRFAVTVVVDGAAGGLAGAGGSAVGGPIGGAVAAGVVGGLASHGADDILFG